MSASIKTLHQKAQRAIEHKDYRLAHQCLITIIQHEPLFADTYFLLGIIASDHNQLDKAIRLFIQADKLQPNNIEYIASLAKLYALTSQPILAQQTLQEIEKQNIEKLAVNSPKSSYKIEPYTLDTIGVTYSHLGLHEKAMKYFTEACLLKPNNANYLFNLATSLRFIGKFELARQHYKKAINNNSKLYKAYSSLSSLSDENNAISIDHLSCIYQSLDNPNDKLYIGHALAREYELLKDYAQSFDTLLNVKTEKLRSLNYSLADDKALFKAIKKQFQAVSSEYITTEKSNHIPANKEQRVEFKTELNKTNEALFIVGMPRTGTTLVERILSNHVDVTSAGELQNFGRLFKQFSQSNSPHVIDQETVEHSKSIDFKLLGETYINSTRHLTSTTQHFIDKMPLNVLYAGFIIKALPNVKIICLDRNPLDTVISNFKQLFSIDSTQYNYAYDLNTTAEFYLLFRDLALFWQQKYPNNFYIINYESLVEQPEIESKKLFDFCQLPWSNEYLNITKNNSPVATASTLQVSKPIHTKSVNYWKNFNEYLDSVKEILKPVLP